MTPPQRITPSPRPPSPAPVSRSSLTPPPTLSRRNSFTARPVTPPPQPPSPGVYRSPYHRLSASPPAHRPPSSSSSRSISPTSTRSSPITPARPILEVHGDSFCGVFTLLGKRASVYKYKGASARGLNNPHSTLQVGAQLLDRLEYARPQSVLLMFGTVDLTLNFLWQLKARGSAAAGPDETARKVLADYASFLAHKIVPLAERSGMTVYVAGVSPPVIEDRYLESTANKYLEKQGISPLPPLSQAHHPHDFATRANMVKRYNTLLASFCARHDCLSYVDINRDLVDPADPSRRVKRQFLDLEDPTNIHLVWETTLPFWVRRLPPLTSLSSHLASQVQVSHLERSLEQYQAEKRERVRRRSGVVAG
ncbi:hypothetical protein NBRC10512_007892 [Rhodotorula toruloides]|uniref:RHTO0S04e04544g1_1 n=2 Tax=Rhodotorula toruloides TaxID=5286 RepID=A0A061AVH9_RHOTO|nr:uncharacterized protein RHTO_01954 [Rhodotorula toruloides NP11]EMS21084.1 hypothetical protein RHTO_01954 [Rhodotorula toruloides NP11]CDR39380.1 RHTO0S04e04544g1_1 [Rhodotorula toruloides]